MTDNPLLDAWRNVYGDAPERDYDRDFVSGRFAMAFEVRNDACERYSFAVTGEEALDLIASYGPVVEIGAGTGYWAKMLRARDCDVIAYDKMEDRWRHWFPGGTVDTVLVGDTDKAAAHADRTLLLVWPPYEDPMAFDAVTAYTEAGGQRVIYIGEGSGGCTANDDFFTLMDKECYIRWDDETHDCATHPPSVWQEVKSIAVPQWDGIHDYLTVFERKDET